MAVTMYYYLEVTSGGAKYLHLSATKKNNNYKQTTDVNRGWEEYYTELSSDRYFMEYYVLDNVIKPNTTAYWFQAQTNKIMNLSYLDTSNVTNMSYMFNFVYQSGVYEVTQAIKNFNTSNVTDMSYMFNSFSRVELDLSNFNTSKVTNMNGMFYDCDLLQNLILSNFNTSNVTNMRYMFYNCNELEALDVSMFDTSNVTDMGAMFQNCSTIISLDLTNFNVKNISNIYGMSNMFRDCKELTTIYCNDDWKLQVPITLNSPFMFNGCNNLVGAISYNLSKVSLDYANPTTGYFTRLVVPKLYFNDTKINTVYFNDTPITKVYFNDTLVFDKGGT